MGSLGAVGMKQCEDFEWAFGPDDFPFSLHFCWTLDLRHVIFIPVKDCIIGLWKPFVGYEYIFTFV